MVPSCAWAIVYSRELRIISRLIIHMDCKSSMTGEIFVIYKSAEQSSEPKYGLKTVTLLFYVSRYLLDTNSTHTRFIYNEFILMSVCRIRETILRSQWGDYGSNLLHHDETLIHPRNWYVLRLSLSRLTATLCVKQFMLLEASPISVITCYRLSMRYDHLYIQ